MTEKKTPQYLRMTDKHPTMVKLMKLWDLAEELKLHISFDGHTTVVSDDELPNDHPRLRLEDRDSGDPVGEWPAAFEYKVVFENPKWLAEQKKILADKREKEEEARKKVSEMQKAASEKRAAEQRAKEAARAKELEQSERALLATLKQKYGE